MSKNRLAIDTCREFVASMREIGPIPKTGKFTLSSRKLEIMAKMAVLAQNWEIANYRVKNEILANLDKPQNVTVLAAIVYGDETETAQRKLRANLSRLKEENLVDTDGHGRWWKL